MSDYDALIASGRVGRATRAALEDRARPDDPGYVPAAMDAAAFAVLRAAVERVVPQPGAVRIDLAQRIDRELAAGTGDGWRFATLPPDARAYADALRTLDVASHDRFGKPFAELDGSSRDDLLAHLATGDLATRGNAGALTGAQMKSWFEELRADAVKAYVLHPATLARIGYSGFANGGDGEPKSGFARVGLGEREAWEPVAEGDAHA